MIHLGDDLQKPMLENAIAIMGVDERLWKDTRCDALPVCITLLP
jgi:hypothetical protein